MYVKSKIFFDRKDSTADQWLSKYLQTSSSSSSEKLLEMQNYWASSQTYWIRNRSRPSNLSFKKPSRRSWCIWKFDNHCCRLEQRNIFFIMWLCSFSHQEKSSLSTPLESGLVLWSALTNRMWQYWQCTSCVPWPQEFFHFSSPLVPWHCHV